MLVFFLVGKRKYSPLAVIDVVHTLMASYLKITQK